MWLSQILISARLFVESPDMIILAYKLMMIYGMDAVLIYFYSLRIYRLFCYSLKLRQYVSLSKFLSIHIEETRVLQL